MRDMDDDFNNDTKDTPTYADIASSSIRRYTKRIASFIASFISSFVDIISTVGKLLLYMIVMVNVVFIITRGLDVILTHIPDEIYADVIAGTTVIIAAFLIYLFVDVWQRTSSRAFIASVVLGGYNFLLCLQFAYMYFSYGTALDAADVFQMTSASFGAIGGFFSVLLAYMELHRSIQ